MPYVIQRVRLIPFLFNQVMEHFLFNRSLEDIPNMAFAKCQVVMFVFQILLFMCSYVFGFQEKIYHRNYISEGKIL